MEEVKFVNVVLRAIIVQQRRRKCVCFDLKNFHLSRSVQGLFFLLVEVLVSTMMARVVGRTHRPRMLAFPTHGMASTI